MGPATFLRFLIEEESATGPFNLTAPNPVTNKEFGKALGQAMNRPALVPVPAFTLRLALGEVATIILEGQRVIPQRLQELGFTFLYPEINGALENLLQEQNQPSNKNELMLA